MNKEILEPVARIANIGLVLLLLALAGIMFNYDWRTSLFIVAGALVTIPNSTYFLPLVKEDDRFMLMAVLLLVGVMVMHPVHPEVYEQRHLW